MYTTLLRRSLGILKPVSILNRSILWNTNLAENTVDITFCFANGEEQKVKARIGDSLKDTADAFHLPVPGDCRGLGLPRKVFSKEHWTKDVFDKEGRNCQYCHVVLEDAIMDKVSKPEVGETMWLEKWLVNRAKNSRLACQIKVTKDLDGTTVFVPECVQ